MHKIIVGIRLRSVVEHRIDTVRLERLLQPPVALEQFRHGAVRGTRHVLKWAGRWEVFGGRENTWHWHARWRDVLCRGGCWERRDPQLINIGGKGRDQTLRQVVNKYVSVWLRIGLLLLHEDWEVLLLVQGVLKTQLYPLVE